jgi:hypothetical protein|uniref:Uncharacterized protein n=1 Tax=Siphoviridae sp. cti6f5 TaxID=2826430 RepID=A0A8S5MCU3_9CAUD|nr:MAG TPA: hypothetical protein [Siphoviridae sp. cti6f5]DAK49981.1 MAG TPA: hypothetical protein [Caudoviricetes sp.]DAP11802.1 MAG TPA: hypothetical protein [Caudoviricetes sp.]DAT02944.1 MAG TPA: hypothetical protein [Caudoviricetes sp.]
MIKIKKLKLEELTVKISLFGLLTISFKFK